MSGSLGRSLLGGAWRGQSGCAGSQALRGWSILRADVTAYRGPGSRAIFHSVEATNRRTRDRAVAQVAKRFGGGLLRDAKVGGQLGQSNFPVPLCFKFFR